MRLSPANRFRSRRAGNRDGFTLTEVIVASFISTMLITVLVGTVVNLRATLRAQQLIGEMHQNVRFAMDTVSRDVRTAGYGLDVYDAVLDDWVTWINGFTENPMIIEGTGDEPDELVILGALDGPATSLAAPASEGDHLITVVNPSDFNTFDKSIIYIGQTTTARILAISGNNLTISIHPKLTRGLEFDYPAGAPVERVQEIRYRWYDATDYPNYPFLSRLDMGKNYTARWMRVAAGYIDDFRVTRNGAGLDIAITGVVAHPDRRYTHPVEGDRLRRETLVSKVVTRN